MLDGTSRLTNDILRKMRGGAVGRERLLGGVNVVPLSTSPRIGF